MSQHKIELRIDVDDEALAAHNGDVTPPPNKVDEWDASDLLAAIHAGIVDVAEAEITDYSTVA